MKKGLETRLPGGPSAADEPVVGCKLYPRCEGCDSQQLENCYDVDLCSHTTWERTLRILPF